MLFRSLRIQDLATNDWEIDAIVGKRVEGGCVQYEVKWKGVDARGRPWKNSWYNVNLLGNCRAFIDTFEKNQGQGDKNKKRKRATKKKYR